MLKRTKPMFNLEFILKTEQLVVGQGYTIREAEAMNVSKSSIEEPDQPISPGI